MKKALKVFGMHCHSCEILLSDVIEELGVKVLSASHVKGELIVDLQNDEKINEIRTVVEKEGYKLV